MISHGTVKPYKSKRVQVRKKIKMMPALTKSVAKKMLAPAQAEYPQSLGALYEATGRRKEAIACFKRAIDVEFRLKRGGGIY